MKSWISQVFVLCAFIFISPGAGFGKPCEISLWMPDSVEVFEKIVPGSITTIGKRKLRYIGFIPPKQFGGHSNADLFLGANQQLFILPKKLIPNSKIDRSHLIPYTAMQPPGHCLAYSVVNVLRKLGRKNLSRRSEYYFGVQSSIERWEDYLWDLGLKVHRAEVFAQDDHVERVFKDFGIQNYDFLYDDELKSNTDKISAERALITNLQNGGANIFVFWIDEKIHSSGPTRKQGHELHALTGLAYVRDPVTNYPYVLVSDSDSDIDDRPFYLWQANRVRNIFHHRDGAAILVPKQ